MWAAVQPALEVLDAAHAQPRSLGQRLLRQPGGCPVSPQQISKAARLGTAHRTRPFPPERDGSARNRPGVCVVWVTCVGFAHKERETGTNPAGADT